MCPDRTSVGPALHGTPWQMADLLDPATNVRRRVFELLERGKRYDYASRAFDALMIVLILANVAATILCTSPAVAATHGHQLLIFDRICVAIFALEYAGRLWTSVELPGMREVGDMRRWRWRYALTPMMLVDLAAILPLVLELAFPAIAELALLRLVRFLKIARYTPALSSIGHVIAEVYRPLVACLVLFAALVIGVSAIMYALEGKLQPDQLGDMPSAMWWSVVFLTKLGQVSALPQTLAGKLFAVLFMLLGIGFIALPVGIIGRGFYDEIRRRDFVVTFAMVSRVPLFSTLDAATIAQLVSLLKARKIAAGNVIIHKGEAANAMFLIADGEVAISVNGRFRILQEGDFFGEMALLSKGLRTATVTARRACDLLVLDLQDFEGLMTRNPALAKAVRDTAEARRQDAKTSPP